MSYLYIVATPIGNLEDITLRALRILREVDLILCEDTRVTRKLLDRYKIKTPTISYHEHSKLKRIKQITELLKRGKNLALVSDAGTPGVSDPGNKLIDQLTGILPDLKIVPLPGPSAATAALSVSGFRADKFVFLGFPPHKKGRQKFFKRIADSDLTTVFYESPHRILKTAQELHEQIREASLRLSKGNFGNRRIVVCRELTKMFETIYRGTIEEVIEQIRKGKIKGEFVVIVEALKTRSI